MDSHNAGITRSTTELRSHAYPLGVLTYMVLRHGTERSSGTVSVQGKEVLAVDGCAAVRPVQHWRGRGRSSGTWRVRARTRLGCGKMGGRRVAKRGGRGGCEGERRSLFCLALVLVLSVLVPALACRVRFRAWVGHFLKLYL